MLRALPFKNVPARSPTRLHYDSPRLVTATVVWAQPRKPHGTPFRATQRARQARHHQHGCRPSTWLLDTQATTDSEHQRARPSKEEPTARPHKKAYAGVLLLLTRLSVRRMTARRSGSGSPTGIAARTGLPRRHGRRRDPYSTPDAPPSRQRKVLASAGSRSARDDAVHRRSAKNPRTQA